MPKPKVSKAKEEDPIKEMHSFFRELKVPTRLLRIFNADLFVLTLCFCSPLCVFLTKVSTQALLQLDLDLTARPSASEGVQLVCKLEVPSLVRS